MGAEEYRAEIAHLLKELGIDTTPFRTVGDEWLVGKMPRTPEQLLRWATLLQTAIRRVDRQRDAAERLLGVVCVQANEAGGLSLREIAAALGLSVGKVHLLVLAGREILDLREAS